jgi:peptidoglycan/LPS O-acetylase OafA/YrhL
MRNSFGIMGAVIAAIVIIAAVLLWFCWWKPRRDRRMDRKSFQDMPAAVAVADVTNNNMGSPEKPLG